MSNVQHQADQQALVAFRSAGVKINGDYFRVLGCVVGATDTQIAEELRTNSKFSADQRVAFQRVPLLSKQTGALALQALTGSVLTNRLRAMTPASTAAHAAEYDAQVLRIAHKLVGITPVHGNKFDAQLRWPLQAGGMGLVCAAEIAPGAYIAGLAGTVASSPAFASVWRGDGELDPAWAVYDAVADAIRRVTDIEQPLIAQCPPDLAARVSASILPEDPSAFLQHVRALASTCLIQSAVSHRISTLSHIAVVTQAGRREVGGEAEVARFRSLQSKDSSLWLRTLPVDSYRRLSDVKWQWAAQLRLGMPVPAYEPDTDGHGCTHEAAAFDGWHTLNCFARSSAEINRRHHAVVSRLAHFARVATLTVHTEPADLSERRDRRPDIQVDLPDVTLLGDVTFVHPEAKTWKRVAATRGVEALGDKREAKKNDHYAEMAEQCDMQFSAFVLYTSGGHHSSAVSFIRQLSSAVDPATCLISCAEWKKDLKEQIAIAVQRGNADIMIQDSARRRGARWQRRRIGRSPSSRPSSARLSPPLRRAHSTQEDVADAAASASMPLVARLVDLSNAPAECASRNSTDTDTEEEADAVSSASEGVPSSFPPDASDSESAGVSSSFPISSALEGPTIETGRADHATSSSPTVAMETDNAAAPVPRPVPDVVRRARSSGRQRHQCTDYPCYCGKMCENLRAKGRSAVSWEGGSE
jgi:hypothetical protein